MLNKISRWFLCCNKVIITKRQRKTCKKARKGSYMVRITKTIIKLNKEDILTTLSWFKPITMVILNFSIYHKIVILTITPIITLKLTLFSTLINRMIHPIKIPSRKMNPIKIHLSPNTARSNQLINLAFAF